MSHSPVHLARGILRNAAALFLVSVFAKGMGLIIAVLIARFLGPDAMGLYALLFSIAMLLEAFISIGLANSLIRDVAARPNQASNLFFSTLKLVVMISLVPAVVLALAAVLVDDTGATRASLLVMAAGTPVSGAFVLCQAVLQGTERVLLLTWVTFLARMLSLIWLAFVLFQGAGVEAAFGSRLMFQGLATAVFITVLWRARTDVAADFTVRSLFTRSLPFALIRTIGELNIRVPSLVLPGMMGFALSGVFDTANRIRGILAMTMAAPIVGMMPSFARHFADPGSQSDRFIGYSVKYMCLVMTAVATVIGLGAEWIISLLFGPAFSGALLPLQILIWAQALVAVDAVLQQVMLAAGREYTAVRHSVVGVAAQLALIVVLGYALGLPGAALSVLLSSALMLLIDLRFVVKSVTSIPLGQFAFAPLAAAALVAGVMLFVHDQPFALRVLVVLGSWVVAMALFRLLPREELRFMMRLVPLSRAKFGRNS